MNAHSFQNTNLLPTTIEPKTFYIHFLFSRSGELTGGYDNPNEEYTPPDDGYAQPTGYTSSGPVGYGSEADGKEIVAVKQNRQNYYAHNVFCYYTLLRTLQLRFNICNRR